MNILTPGLTSVELAQACQEFAAQCDALREVKARSDAYYRANPTPVGTSLYTEAEQAQEISRERYRISIANGFLT